MRVAALFLLFYSFVFGQKIAVLSPAINEIVFELGRGSDVVANTTYCDYPPESKRIPKLGGFFDISYEKLLASKPDIVLGELHHVQLLEKLKNRGYKTKILNLSRASDIKESILEIGSVLGAQKEAKELSISFEKAFLQKREIREECTALVVFGAQESFFLPVFVSGNNLYFKDILDAIGCKNALKSETLSQPSLDKERIKALNPTYIFILANEATLDEKRVIDAWSTLKIDAAKNGKITIINKEYSMIPSQRALLLLQDFKERVR